MKLKTDVYQTRDNISSFQVVSKHTYCSQHKRRTLSHPAVHPTFKSLHCSHRFELPMGNCWEIIVRVFFFFPFTFITFDRRIIVRFIIGRREKLRTGPDIRLFRKHETTYI